LWQPQNEAKFLSEIKLSAARRGAAKRLLAMDRYERWALRPDVCQRYKPRPASLPIPGVCSWKLSPTIVSGQAGMAGMT
jgi:hypothetical protein